MTGTAVARAVVALSVLSACAAGVVAVGPGARTAQSGPPILSPAAAARLAAMKQDAASDVESMRELSQQMVDQLFSYAELGYQEFETSRYLTATLEKHGFRIERNIAGIPTGWTATWGSGCLHTSRKRAKSSRQRAPSHEGTKV